MKMWKTKVLYTDSIVAKYDHLTLSSRRALTIWIQKQTLNLKIFKISTDYNVNISGFWKSEKTKKWKIDYWEDGKRYRKFLHTIVLYEHKYQKNIKINALKWKFRFFPMRLRCHGWSKGYNPVYRLHKSPCSTMFYNVP